jgi:zona occludens toxin (predicted ATPase)
LSQKPRPTPIFNAPKITFFFFFFFFFFAFLFYINNYRAMSDAARGQGSGPPPVAASSDGPDVNMDTLDPAAEAAAA